MKTWSVSNDVAHRARRASWPWRDRGRPAPAATVGRKLVKRLLELGRAVPLVDDPLGDRRELVERAAAASWSWNSKPPVRERPRIGAGFSAMTRAPGDRRRAAGRTLGEDRVEGLALRAALVPGRERDEDGADVRREGPGQRVEAAEQVRADDARRPEQDALHLLRDLEGALEGRAVGELEARDEVALVLVGDEARRHDAEQQRAWRRRGRVTREHDAAPRQQRAHAAVVAPHDRAEAAVEAAEEAPLVLRLAPHPERAERGRERQRVQQRDQHRAAHREAELAQQQPGRAGQERDRHEHGAEHERRGHDGARHLAHRARHGLAARAALRRAAAPRSRPPRSRRRPRGRSRAPARTA